MWWIRMDGSIVRALCFEQITVCHIDFFHRLYDHEQSDRSVQIQQKPPHLCARVLCACIVLCVCVVWVYIVCVYCVCIVFVYCVWLLVSEFACDRISFCCFPSLYSMCLSHSSLCFCLSVCLPVCVIDSDRRRKTLGSGLWVTQHGVDVLVGVARSHTTTFKDISKRCFSAGSTLYSTKVSFWFHIEFILTKPWRKGSRTPPARVTPPCSYPWSGFWPWLFVESSKDASFHLSFKVERKEALASIILLCADEFSFLNLSYMDVLGATFYISWLTE